MVAGCRVYALDYKAVILVLCVIMLSKMRGSKFEIPSVFRDTCYNIQSPVLLNLVRVLAQW